MKRETILTTSLLTSFALTALLAMAGCGGGDGGDDHRNNVNQQDAHRNDQLSNHPDDHQQDQNDPQNGAGNH